VVAFDNKSSAQETTLQVQAAFDQGIRFLYQGAGSNNGHAMKDAIAKHNARNPDRMVLYLDHGALDPTWRAWATTCTRSAR
jgi:branched-chain amino acid transport system substrate-binding protein